MNAPLPSASRIDLSALERRMRTVRWFYRRLGLALLVVLVAMPALQVLLREVFRHPFIGAEELTRFMLICVVFVTLPYVVASGANIRMEEILETTPRPLRRPLRALIALTGSLGFGLAAISVAVATLRNLDNATPTLQIPYWIFFSAAFFGLAFAAVESGFQLIKILRRRDPYVSFTGEGASGAATQL